MTIEQDQALVRSVNEQRLREKARITYTARTWAEKWNDVAWLQQRVTELEKWHMAGNGMWVEEIDDDTVSICRHQHGPDDGCEWVEYRRVEP